MNCYLNTFEQVFDSIADTLSTACLSFSEFGSADAFADYYTGWIAVAEDAAERDESGQVYCAYNAVKPGWYDMVVSPELRITADTAYAAEFERRVRLELDD